MLLAGLINRRGTVEQQNTVSDYHDIEHERGASVFATPLRYGVAELQDQHHRHPGLDDFIGEIIASIGWPTPSYRSSMQNTVPI